MTAFGDWLKNRRETVGLNQEELAARSGVAASTISKIERGEVSPRRTTLRLLAAPLGVSSDDLEDAARRGRGLPALGGAHRVAVHLSPEDHAAVPRPAWVIIVRPTERKILHQCLGSLVLLCLWALGWCVWTVHKCCPHNWS